MIQTSALTGIPDKFELFLPAVAIPINFGMVSQPKNYLKALATHDDTQSTD